MARAGPRATPPRRVTRSQSRELDDSSGLAHGKTAAMHESHNAKASSSRECHCPYSALSLLNHPAASGIYARV